MVPLINIEEEVFVVEDKNKFLVPTRWSNYVYTSALAEYALF